MLTIQVNDVFDELREENQRLNQIVSDVSKLRHILDKLRNSLSDVIIECKCELSVRQRDRLTDLRRDCLTITDQLSAALQTDPQKSDTTYVRKRINVVKRDEIVSPKTTKTSPKSIKLEEESEEEFDPNDWSDNESDEESEAVDKYLTADTEYSFSIQERHNYKYKRLVCNFTDCDFQCLREPKMKKHIGTAHRNRDAIKCKDCGKVCWGKYQMGNHIKQDHSDQFDFAEQKFICTFVGCSQKFSKYSQVEKHGLRHTGEKTFICAKDYPGCEWTFFTQGELRNHQLNSHMKQGNWLCDWPGCGYRFKTRGHLDLHKLHNHCQADTSKMELLETVDDSFNNNVEDRTYLKSDYRSHYSVVRNLTTNKIKSFICNYSYCVFKTRVKNLIEKHVTDIHLKKTPQKCIECYQSFWSHQLVANHIKEKHPNLYDQSVNMFVCTQAGCGLQFDRFSKLTRHRNRHFGEKTYVCADDYPGCDWKFFTLGELRNHQTWSHREEYPFLCDWEGCGRRFKLNHLLVEHRLSVHTPEAMPYTCEWPGCDRRFVRNTSLKIHMDCHVGDKQFSCDWPECGQMFRNTSNLKAHYAIHTDDRRHRCEWPGCEMRFITKTSLNRHKISHQSGPGQYHCPWAQCDKVFKQKSSLRVHLMSHSGERPHKCLECDKRFIQKNKMLRHFRRIHEKELNRKSVFRKNV